MLDIHFYLILVLLTTTIITVYYYKVKNHSNINEPYDIDEMNISNTLLIEKSNDYINSLIPTLKDPPVIPLKIFQTWHSKNLPPEMKKCVFSLKKSNPEFEYYIFDDNDCREFIKNHFSIAVLNAFDKLKPGAFKADLWRCCILYVYGGIYLDIKFSCVNGFKFITLTNDEYFVRDYGNDLAVYNALMICKPHNHILLNSIKQIVQNVQLEYYGTSPLEVTGPKMMIKFFTPNEKRNLTRLYLKVSGNDLCITNEDGKTILRNYAKYKVERQTFQINQHYSVLWGNHNIYN
jgi:mannosyltransferase OCH1-like enzyme